MKKVAYFKSFSIIFLIFAALFVFSPQAYAGGVVRSIAKVVVDVAVVVAVVAIGVAAGAIVAQAGLSVAASVFTTLAGTAIVSATIIGASLWAADCLFDNGPIDPNIICRSKESGGAMSGNAFQVDLKIVVTSGIKSGQSSDGPIDLAAPANFRIEWAIAGADSTTNCNAFGNWSGEIKESAGKAEVNNLGNGNYNYGITCNRSSDGASVSDNVVVNVTSLPIIDFNAPSPVELPDPVRLFWATEAADSCDATGDWSGSKAAGPLPYKTESISKPRGEYTFNLACSGPGGNAFDSKNVRVIQVPRCSFSTTPSSIANFLSSVLAWNCQYADSCSINQGIGSVNNISGTKEVRPTKTTTYTLTCSGLDGSRSYDATVNVFTPQPSRLRETPPN